ncbi:MAG: DUF1653 domain-containing protein [Firmicutes bacterium]|nr:DUF1653 domain-containing protein [Bacillota bacterium]
MEEIKIGIYRHFKGGIYRVVGMAIHSETQEEMVLYQASSNGLMYVRPIRMWNEIVERGGETFRRFEFIGDEIT